jgi:hypothetical protein
MRYAQVAEPGQIKRKEGDYAKAKAIPHLPILRKAYIQVSTQEVWHVLRVQTEAERGAGTMTILYLVGLGILILFCAVIVIWAVIRLIKAIREYRREGNEYSN